MLTNYNSRTKNEQWDLVEALQEDLEEAAQALNPDTLGTLLELLETDPRQLEALSLLLKTPFHEWFAGERSHLDDYTLRFPEEQEEDE